ncbi:MAG: hypothetical protein KJ709_05565 [Nanoarchaeota archaeon]|nr:hypothetical protein [Nanoarchaeota archaeon]
MRKGIINTLPNLIIVLIVISLLFLFGYKLREVMAPAGVDRDIGPFINAYLRDPLMKFEILKLEFPIQTRYIDQDTVEDCGPYCIEGANEQGYFQPEFDMDPKKYNKQVEDRQVEIWELAMNEIVAYEMEDCWHDMGEGRLPLFDKWYSRINREWQGPPKYEEWVGYYGKDQPPVFCVICARIEVDPEVSAVVGNEITSLPRYLQKFPTKHREGLSIMNYMRTAGESALYSRDYKYSTDEPWAVIFARVNTLQTTKIFDWFASKKVPIVNFQISRDEYDHEDKSAMFLVPYREVDMLCTHLANS